VNCKEFRAATGADPRATRADLAAHAAGCEACAAWRRELLRMDDVIRRALAFDVGAERTVGPALPARSAWRRPAWRGWAMAAGVACATLVAGLLWLAPARAALADAVVAHMSEEPGAWARTDSPADPVLLARVLARAGVRLNAGAGVASYANSCWFRGHHVPHLVFQTDDGPVTVMVLPAERVAAAIEFDEQGYRGVLVPAERGALAILSRGAMPSRELTARLQAAFAYSEK
jgi:hypothetical protein